MLRMQHQLKACSSDLGDDQSTLLVIIIIKILVLQKCCKSTLHNVECLRNASVKTPMKGV